MTALAPAPQRGAIALLRPLFERRPGPVAMVLGALALVILLQIELVLSKSISWDEFFHFGLIHQDLLGRSTRWLQVPEIWLFPWVPSLPGDGITHIQIIRLLILPFEIVTIAAIVACARRFVDRETALLCGLLYLTGGYVFLHGFALRADMIAAALLMSALWVGLCKPLRWPFIALMAVLVALAFLSTIKTVLYAPAFLGVMLYRIERPPVRVAVAIAAAAAVAGGALFLIAGPSLPETGATGLLRDIAVLGRDSVERMFFSGMFPQGRYLLKQILMAPVLTIAIGLAVAFAFRRQRWERVLMLCLIAPLFTVAIYYNAFPYHYAFILPPAVIAAAPAVDFLRRRYGAAPFALLLVANAAVLSLVENRDVLHVQRTVQSGIHTMFPEPVVYIDESAMAGSFPRAVNHFASGWGLENYLKRGVPTYSLAMKAEPVPLLIINSYALKGVFEDTGSPVGLLPEDVRTLRENYIPHWGIVRVAGKAIPAGGAATRIEIAVPGPYTVEGGPVVLDGKRYGVGDTLHLERGWINVGGDRTLPVTLRWGDKLPVPATPWPVGPMFTEY